MNRKTKRLLVSLTLDLGLTVSLLWLPGRPHPVSGASERMVCPSGCPYSSIQDAVDAAENGDVIKVAAGTYADVHTRAGVMQVVYIDKSVTIRGGYTNAFIEPPKPDVNLTTVNAGDQGRGFYIASGISTTIEGLRMTSGNATGLGGGPASSDAGGGVYGVSVTATISNCRIWANTASTSSGGYGGGLYFQNSTVTLNGNTVTGNSATTAQGSDGYGGGVYLRDSPARLEGNTISQNTASLSGGGGGGGLYLDIGEPALWDNAFTDNTAQRGGGLYLFESSPILTNTVIADNQATVSGGAIYVQNSTPRLLHTTFARNSTTVVGDGSGVYVTYEGDPSGVTALNNTILAGHQVGISVTAGSTATLQATLWYANSAGNWDGGGTINHTQDITGSPAFDSDGFHLLCSSAAIDAGVNVGVAGDIDGDLRDDGLPDIGADECLERCVYLPMVARHFQ